MIITNVEAGHLPQAGFWRRIGALMIDLLVVLVPLQIVAAILFAATNGTLQQSAGLNFAICDQVPAASLERFLSDLVPPPPQGANYGVICTDTIFGWPTARNLTVGVRSSQMQDLTTVLKNVSTGYPLSASGELTRSYDWTWLTALSFLGYYLFFLSRNGQTFGMRRLSMRLVSLLESSIGLRQTLIRLCIVAVPALPYLLVFAWLTSNAGWDTDAHIAAVVDRTWNLRFTVSALAGLGLAFLIFAPLVSRKTPWHDRFARTSVIMTDRPK